MLTKLKEIASNLKKQDNRCTSDPIFLVQEQVKVWGVDPDIYDDAVMYFRDTNDGESIYETKEELGEFVRYGGDTDDLEKGYYILEWKTVTSCFTEKGAEDYIAANKHNLGKTRIYVDSLWRNAEMIAIREYLLTLI